MMMLTRRFGYSLIGMQMKGLNTHLNRSLSSSALALKSNRVSHLMSYSLGFSGALCAGFAVLQKPPQTLCISSAYETPLIKREPLPVKVVKDSDKWNLMLSLMAKDKIYYLVAALCSILGSVAGTAQGKIIGDLFDLMGSGDVTTLYKPIKTLLTLMVGQAGLSFLSSFVLAAAGTEFGRRLRELFYRSILYQDIEKFEHARTGELTHQLSQDIGSLQTAVRTAFSRGIEGMTSIISGGVYLYMASPKLAVCMLTLLPTMSLAAHLLGVLLRSLSGTIRKAENVATGVANETLGAVKTVRSFGATEREIERYSEQLRHVSSLKRLMALAAGGFYAMLGLGINAITLVICGYGGHLVSTGELTRGGIAAIVTQVQILERSMAKLSMISAQLIKAFRASEHIFDTIADEPRVNTAKGGLGLFLAPATTQGRVVFDHVEFRYPTRKNIPVLDDFNLVIEPGETVALVGNSGGGKSTLTALIERFYDVDNGSVSIDGIDVRDIDPDSLHQIVGIVSQEPILFGTSIIDNIRYGKPDATEEEVIEAAKSANAHAFISRFPNGYHTQLGERGVLLSGGQKQRIAIARAILSDPRVLILDEATSALDAESEYLVQQALSTLMQGRTTLIIAHRLGTIKNADTICVLEQGTIIEKGTHKGLIQNPESQYRALFQRQNTKS